MSRKKLILSLLLVPIAIAIGIGALNIRSASAATGTTDQTALIASFPNGNAGPGIGGVTKESLATALGITVDELTKAIQTAKSAALTQAVKDGLITQVQADEITTNGRAFPLGKNWGGWLSKNGIDFQALLADALGISVDELKAAYAEAFYAQVDQAVTNGKLSEEQANLIKGRFALRSDTTFQTTMKSAYEAAVQQAVKSGVITQAQADLILKNVENKAGGMDILDGTPGLNNMGGRPGHGGRGGGWEAPDASTPTTTVP